MGRQVNTLPSSVGGGVEAKRMGRKACRREGSCSDSEEFEVCSGENRESAPVTSNFLFHFLSFL